MYVVTLLSARRAPRVSHALASEAAVRLGGAEIDWLAPGVACDLLVNARPAAEVLDALRRTAGAEAADCVVQERAGRRKRILLADMDSTVIDQECIDELAAEIGIKDLVADITRRAMNGEVAFEPALRERVKLLKDLPVETVGRVLETRISLSEGGRELVRTMRLGGAYTALVSGGFTLFTSVVAARLGFDEDRANRLNVADGRLTGTVAEPILGSAAKLEALREIAAARGLTPQDAIAVGDGANDLAMLGEAGTGVAMHAKPVVAAAAAHRIDHGDLTALLFMQGYREEDLAA